MPASRLRNPFLDDADWGGSKETSSRPFSVPRHPPDGRNRPKRRPFWLLTSDKNGRRTMARLDPAEDTPDRASLLSAYRAGRDDERARIQKDPGDTRVRDKRWRDAYERGRRDERARR